MAKKKIRLGVVMDPIGSIQFKKDTTLAILLEAQRRKYEISYMEPQCLYVESGQARAFARKLQVRKNPSNWFMVGEPKSTLLESFDVLLMRKDPPFDIDYIYLTYILELAQAKGTLVVNRPNSLRDVNEKLYTMWFPQCCPPSVVTSSFEKLTSFLRLHRRIVVKPIDRMGGASIFLLKSGDVNTNVTIETLTNSGKTLVVAQRFIPDVKDGDKRILLVDGKPIPYALLRVPAKDDFRGNLAKGAKGVGVKLTRHDIWLCGQIGPALRKKGLMFVGLDVIGKYVTEINVTSPTCVRELDRIYSINISATLLDAIESKLTIP